MMYRFTKEIEYKNKIFDVVEVLFEKLNTKEFSITYDSGITGIAYMLEYLRKNDIIKNEDISEHLEFFHSIILNFCLTPITQITEIDFLHGKLGSANYLLKRYSENENIGINITTIFENISKIINEDINEFEKVKNKLNVKGNAHRTNCGLAHGHVSSILIMSNYLQIFPENKIINKTLRRLVNCLLEFKSPNITSLSCFPSIAVNKYLASYNTPLGWCYGDQTASLGIYKASQVLNDYSLEQEAKLIALDTLKRDTVSKALSPISDAGFCHGVSSLAYLNKKWYQITKEEKFNSRYNTFIKTVLEKGNDDLGLAGYRKHSGNNNHEKSIGLLTGIIGIGVVLIDYLNEDTSLMWDEFFLLD